MGLILPQIINVKINASNSNHYKSKGYLIPEKYSKDKKRYVIPVGTEITVSVLDLPKGSHSKVKVQYDCCGKIHDIMYRDIFKNYGYKNTGKLFCKECCKKEFEKNNLHPATKWDNKEYALNKLNEYLKENKIFKKNDTYLNSIKIRLKEHNYDIKELCEQLGYNYNDISRREYDIKYFYDINNLKNAIIPYYNEHGFFPTLKQMREDLFIPSSTIQYHGGVNSVKEKLGIKYDNLKDDNGFYNRSKQEYVLAQFLIHNNITYLREQHPFPSPNKKKRSDFTFILKNGEVYQLEIWACSNIIEGSKFTYDYMKNRKLKESLYKKYNINLISIEPDDFKGGYEKVQSKLREKLKHIISSELKNIDMDNFIDCNDLTNEQLIKEVMKYSNNGKIPTIKVLSKESQTIMNQVLKRYGSYNKFAMENNLETNNKIGVWSKEIVLEQMIKIKLKYDYFPRCQDIIKYKLYKEEYLFIGLHGAIKKCFTSKEYAYLDLYNYCCNNGIKLSDTDICNLKEIYDKYSNKKIILNNEYAEYIKNLILYIDKK